MGDIIPATGDEVRKALEDFIRMTALWGINPQGFIYDLTTGDLIKLKTGKDTELPLFVVGDHNTQVDEPHLVLNPFREGLEGFKKANEEFYCIQRKALYGRLIQLIRLVIRYMQKNADPNIDVDEFCQVDVKNKDLMKIGAKNAENKKKLADLIDEKSWDNIKAFLLTPNQKRDFIFLRNSRNRSSCELVIDFLTDPDYKEKTSLKPLREKDIQALKTIVMGLLCINKPEEISKFSAVSDDIRVPTKLFTFATVLYQIYLRFNPLLQILDSFEEEKIWEVEVDTLKEHIQNLARYAEATKWSIVSSVGDKSIPVQTVAAVTPTVAPSMQPTLRPTPTVSNAPTVVPTVVPTPTVRTEGPPRVVATGDMGYYPSRPVEYRPQPSYTQQYVPPRPSLQQRRGGIF